MEKSNRHWGGRLVREQIVMARPFGPQVVAVGIEMADSG